MSLIGVETAVVSLGCSCQTAWQINQHRDYIAELLGENLARAALPYDWLIMPPMSLVSWLTSCEEFPQSPDEIVQHPNFMWPRHKLHFWHEFVVDGRPALSASFASTKKKFDHLFDNMRIVRQMRRKIFIMSNTQNNLDVVRSVSPLMDITFTSSALKSVMRAIDIAFAGMNEFAFVTYRDRTTDDLGALDADVHFLEPDGSAVFGDDDQWAKLLADIIPERREPRTRRSFDANAGANIHLPVTA